MNEWEWHILEDKTALDSVDLKGVRLRQGDRVRLCPRPGGDVLDLALTGRIASIESIDQDYEGQLHVSVVIEDDPGRDIGLMRQPGHRFFFALEELEPLLDSEEPAPDPALKDVLIVGIGNIFLGDDGFGVEVAARLAHRTFPTGVRVVDFGIRGFDLAYALMEGYRSTILIDAIPGNAPPGTLFIIEPDLAIVNSPDEPSGPIDAHSLNPVSVLRMAARMGAHLQRVLLVGCTPATLGPEEGQMGLSPAVTAALDEAVNLVELLVTRVLRGEWPGTV